MTFDVAPTILAYQLTLNELGKIELDAVLLFSIGAVHRLVRFKTIQIDLPTFVGISVSGAAIGLLLSIIFLSPRLMVLSTAYSVG